MTPRAGLCFDATGTLIELRAPVGDTYRQVALDFGVDLPAWRLEDAFRRVLTRAGAPRGEGATPQARAGNETRAWFDLIRQTFQAADSTVRFPDFEAFAGALFETFGTATAWRIRDDADALRDWLRAIRAEGHGVGVLSNFDHRLPKILEEIEIATFFDFILTPHQLGAAKPAPAAWQAAAAALDCPVDALVYIGDDPPERLAAMRAHGVGILAVHDATGLPRGWEELRRAFTVTASVEGEFESPASARARRTTLGRTSAGRGDTAADKAQATTPRTTATMPTTEDEREP